MAQWLLVKCMFGLSCKILFRKIECCSNCHSGVVSATTLVPFSCAHPAWLSNASRCPVERVCLCHSQVWGTGLGKCLWILMGCTILSCRAMCMSNVPPSLRPSQLSMLCMGGGLQVSVPCTCLHLVIPCRNDQTLIFTFFPCWLGKMITAAYVPLPTYHSLFPDSMTATQLLVPVRRWRLI